MSKPKDRSNQPPPEGFAFQKLDEYSSLDRPLYTDLALFLPLQLHSALLQEDEAAEKAIQQKRDEIRAQERLAEIEEDEKRSSLDALSSSSPKAAAQAALVEAASHSRFFDQEQHACALANPRGWRQVYTKESVEKFRSKAAATTAERDFKRRDEELAKKLTAGGLYRKIGLPAVSENAAASRPARASKPKFPRGNFSKPRPLGYLSKVELREQRLTQLNQLQAASSALDGLRIVYPHFSEVIDFVSQHFALGSQSQASFSLPPILLNGEPGLGKTHFAFALSEVLGTSFRRVSFDTPVTASTLMGSDRKWSNSQYGLLFELVCLGQFANPIIVLDEIDKAVGERNANPLEPLHSLLEPTTSTKVRDVSVDFEFDASLVVWIATANNSRWLSPAIRSRFREFDIQRPDAAGALMSANAVLKTSFEALKLVDFAAPDRAFAVAVAHLTSREVIQVFQQAVANAIVKGKRSVSPDDLPPGVCDAVDTARQGAKTQRDSDKPTTWLH